MNRKCKDWLPEYANGHLHPVKAYFMRQWLSRSKLGQAELVRIQLIRTAVAQQQNTVPSPELFGKIMASAQSQQVERQQAIRLNLLWLVPPLLLIAALVIFWLAFPPAITLEWAVQGREPIAFRVFRAEANHETNQYVLLDELPAKPGEQRYLYLDYRLSPSKRYLYRVDVVDQNGLPTFSQTVTGNGADILPRLAILVLTGITLAFVMWEVRQQLASGDRLIRWYGQVS